MIKPIQGGFPGTIPLITDIPPMAPKSKNIQAAILTIKLEVFKNPKCWRIPPPFLPLFLSQIPPKYKQNPFAAPLDFSHREKSQLLSFYSLSPTPILTGEPWPLA